MNRKKVLLTLIMEYVLYCAVIIIPLLTLEQSFFFFVTSKAIVLIGISFLLLILYLWQILLEYSNIISITRQHLVLFIFLFILLLSSVFSINPQFAFFGGLANGMGLNVIAACSLIACFIAFLSKNNKNFFRNILSISFITSILVVIRLYIPGNLSFLPLSSQGSTLGNDSYLGAYLLMQIMFGIGLLLIESRWWKKILFFSGILLLITSPIIINENLFKGLISISDFFHNPLVLMGRANGAVLGLGFALCTFCSLTLLRSNRKIRQFFGVSIFILIFAIIGILAHVLVNPSSNLHAEYVEEKNPNRFMFWDIASQSSRERPLFGWGLNGYAYAYQEHFSPSLYSAPYVPEVWTNNPHNMFKEYEVNTGYLGLIMYVFLLGSTGIILFMQSRTEDKTKKYICITLFSALGGYIVQNLFLFDTPVILFNLFIIIGYSIYLSVGKKIMLQQEYNRLRMLLSLFGILILVWGFYILCIAPLRETFLWKRYMTVEQTLTTVNPQSISNLGYIDDDAYVADVKLDKITQELERPSLSSIEKNTQIALLKAVIINLEVNLERETYKHFRANWILGNAYKTLGQYSSVDQEGYLSKSIGYLSKARTINPSNPNVYTDIAQVYTVAHRSDIAQRFVRAAIALTPGYYGSYITVEALQKNEDTTQSFDLYAGSMKKKWCDSDKWCEQGFADQTIISDLKHAVPRAYEYKNTTGNYSMLCTKNTGIKEIYQEIIDFAGTANAVCVSNTNNWAMSAKIQSEPNKYYCVDSTEIMRTNSTSGVAYTLLAGEESSSAINSLSGLCN